MSTDQLQAEVTFSIVPTWVIDADVSDRAVRLYAVLAQYAAHDTGACYPGRATLAKRLRCSVDSVDRALAQLQAIEAVTVHRRWNAAGDPTTSMYLLHVTPGGSRTGAARWPHDSGDGSRTGAAQNQNHLNQNPPNPPHAGGTSYACSRHGRHRRSCVDCNNPPADRPIWCGQCDQATRLIELDGAVARCPACHPLRVRQEVLA